MNEALHIISIQHELVLALGHQRDLREMVQRFLRICNRRLSLGSGHLFLYQDRHGAPGKRQPIADDINLQHYASVPKVRRGEPWSQNRRFIERATKFEQSDCAQAFEDTGEYQLLFLKVRHYGVVVFEFEGEKQARLARMLAPVIEHLSLSLSAAIDQDNLKREVRARKIAEEKIRFQASHDELTGLYNRRHFSQLLRQIVEGCKSKQKCGALIFIDLNDFKAINDSLGHNAGDAVLKEIASRLMSGLPQKYYAARFGGDEFVVLLHDLTPGNADAFAKSVIASLGEIIAQPIQLGGSSYTLFFSAARGRWGIQRRN